ncbi:MAG: tRNA (guanosine(46)-N7)-methyltransferase TrmB [Cryomorphaceae bacterium]
MAKKKNERFEEMKSFSCVFEPENEEMRDETSPLKGRWNRDYFKNDNPITLELGCGKGEYTIAMAKKYPNRNFIGIDIKGARLWRGCKTAHEEDLQNVGFLRIKIEFIENFFARDEVSEIWLTFSDPQPKDRKGTKRLTSQHFMRRYAKLLRKDGYIHVKTDSGFLYDRTREVIEAHNHHLAVDSGDVHGKDIAKFDADTREILDVTTFYERKFLEAGENIHYLKYQLNEQTFKDK